VHPGFQCNSMRYQSGKRHSNRVVGDITQLQPLSTMAQAEHRRRPIGIPMLRRDDVGDLGAARKPAAGTRTEPPTWPSPLCPGSSRATNSLKVIATPKHFEVHKETKVRSGRERRLFVSICDQGRLTRWNSRLGGCRYPEKLSFGGAQPRGGTTMDRRHTGNANKREAGYRVPVEE
jgi:hypothetical protein